MNRANPSNKMAQLHDRTVYVISGITFVVLLTGSWTFVILEQMSAQGSIFTVNSFNMATQFLGELLGSGTETPAFYDPDRWNEALRLSIDTLIMSVIGIGMASFGMLVTILFGAQTKHSKALTLASRGLGRFLFYVMRVAYIISRAVPELFWAMFVILVMEPGILAGAVALAIHNFGILGKLCAEVVEDLDLRPIEALRSSGAGLYQALFYGVIPEVTPQFLTYMFYRWESIIRASIVVGFVSAGGIGQQFRLSMSWFQYSEVTLLIICYFTLVVTVDALSGLLRMLAKL